MLVPVFTLSSKTNTKYSYQVDLRLSARKKVRRYRTLRTPTQSDLQQAARCNSQIALQASNYSDLFGKLHLFNVIYNYRLRVSLYFILETTSYNCKMENLF